MRNGRLCAQGSVTRSPRPADKTRRGDPSRFQAPTRLGNPGRRPAWARSRPPARPASPHRPRAGAGGRESPQEGLGLPHAWKIQNEPPKEVPVRRVCSTNQTAQLRAAAPSGQRPAPAPRPRRPAERSRDPRSPSCRGPPARRRAAPTWLPPRAPRSGRGCAGSRRTATRGGGGGARALMGSAPEPAGAAEAAGGRSERRGRCRRGTGRQQPGRRPPRPPPARPRPRPCAPAGTASSPGARRAPLQRRKAAGQCPQASLAAALPGPRRRWPRRALRWGHLPSAEEAPPHRPEASLGGAPAADPQAGGAGLWGERAGLWRERSLRRRERPPQPEPPEAPGQPCAR